MTENTNLYEAFREVALFKTENSSFERSLSKNFPEYIEVFKKLDSEIDNWIINTNELASMYYRSKNDNVKSKKIIIDSAISRFILNASDCRLKTRIQESIRGVKQKSSYVLDKNVNFISPYTKGTELLFISVNESEFKKMVTEYKKTLLLRSYTNLVSKLCQSTDKKIQIGYNYNNSSNANEIYSLSQRNIYLHSMNLDKFCMDLVSTLKRSDENKSSLGTIFNSTFDIHDRNSKLLLKNTKVIQEQSINPISGFVSVKNKRVVLDSCKDQELVLHAIEEHAKTSSFFKEIGDSVKREELKLQRNTDFTVKLISGPEISALYNVSSYFKSAYNYNRSDYPTREGQQGTLFNSCMRRPQSKFEIDFYSNASFVKMLVVSDEKNKTIKARAIVWVDKETNAHYVDRAYVINNEQYALIANYIAERDNFFYIHESLSGILPTSKKQKMLIKVTPTSHKNSLPYFDTAHANYFKKNNEYYVACKNAGNYVDVKYEKDANKKDVLYRLPIALTKGELLGIEEKIETPKYNLKSIRCSKCGRKMLESESISLIDKNGEAWAYLCQDEVTEIDGETLIKLNNERVYYVDKEIYSRKTFSTPSIFTGNKIISNASFILAGDSNSSRHSIAKAACKRASFSHGTGEYEYVEITPGRLKKISANKYQIVNDADYSYKYGIPYDPNLYKAAVFKDYKVLIKVGMNEDEVSMYKAGMKEYFAEKMLTGGFKVSDYVMSNAVASVALGKKPITDFKNYVDGDFLKFEGGGTYHRRGVTIEVDGKKDLAINMYLHYRSGGMLRGVEIPLLLSSISTASDEINKEIDDFVDDYIKNEKSK